MTKTLSRIIKAVAFVAIFAVIFTLLENHFRHNYSVSTNTWNRIQNDEEPVDVVILGNSHANTSTNAKVISEALGLETYVLSSSSQNVSVTKTNVETLLKYKQPKIIMIEAYCVLSENFEKLMDVETNFVYENYDAIENPLDRFLAARQVFDLERQPGAVFQILRSSLMWDRYDDERQINSKKTFTDINGYRYLDSHLTGEYDAEAVSGQYAEAYEAMDAKPLSARAEEDFIAILEMCREKGIEVWIYKAPLPQFNESYVTGMKRLEQLSQPFDNVSFLGDFNLHQSKLGLTTQDWYDTGHLNSSGAGRFSSMLCDIMAQKLEITPNYENVFRYKCETVTAEADGRNICVVEWFGSAQYAFYLYENGELAHKQDYSLNNIYITNADLNAENIQLKYTVMPADGSGTEITRSILRSNSCVLETQTREESE